VFWKLQPLTQAVAWPDTRLALDAREDWDIEHPPERITNISVNGDLLNCYTRSPVPQWYLRFNYNRPSLMRKNEDVADHDGKRTTFSMGDGFAVIHRHEYFDTYDNQRYCLNAVC
jgi:hypothetical protein